MARITLGPFGGLSPSVNARNLTGDGAQRALNLDLRFGDFRPLTDVGGSVTTVAAATKSVFRTPSGVWLSSTTDVDYVNGQINDAEHERVYLTGRSAYPEAWENKDGGAYRRLGVPAPAAKPEATVIVTDEFTAEEADKRKDEIFDLIRDAALANDTVSTMGNQPTPVGPNELDGVDPYANDVMVHLRMAADFSDSGPRSMSIDEADGSSYPTGGGSIAPVISSLNDGPFTTPVKYGVFSEGVAPNTPAYGVKFGTNFDCPEWTIDAWVRMTETVTGVRVYQRGGHIRAVSLITPTRTDKLQNTLCRIGGDWDISGDNGQMMSTTTPFITPANTWALVSITGSIATGVAAVFIDGKKVASMTGIVEPLSSYVGPYNFLGHISEYRITNRARYTEDFDKPTAPFPGAPADPNDALTGFWLPYSERGTTVPQLPTTGEGDYAYLARMNTVGTSMYNADEEYLKQPSLSGVRVKLGDVYWWAVPVTRYMASVMTLDRAAFEAALTALQNTETPPTQLLEDDTISEIVADVGDLYEALISPTRALKDNLLSTERNLLIAISALAGSTLNDAAKASTLRIAIDDVTAASDALRDYYSRIDTAIRGLVEVRYGGAVSNALPDSVVRIVETRAYVYTYVTNWGEESAPSLPSELLELDQNDSVDITVTIPDAATLASRHIVGWRLYRSSVSNAGLGAYQLVADSDATQAVTVPVAPATNGVFDYYAVPGGGVLTDTLSDTLRQEELQETLQTLTWIEPPANLKGLVGMPNGIMAGFFGKTICFCEPFAPYAWPAEYQLTTEFAIVGLGVFGQTLVVLTEGSPYYCSGADSASMSAQKLESTQACVAKRSIAGVEGGVFYASPDGLCLASGNGVVLASQGAFTKEDWLDLEPEDSFATFAEGIYYLTSPAGILDGMIVFDLASKRIGTVTGTGYTELYTDLLTDTVYVASGTSVLPLLGGAFRTAIWRSKRFVLDNIPPFAWLRVSGPLTSSMTVRIYADGTLLHTATVTSREPVRLPPGRYREWEIELEGTSTVTTAAIASGTLELIA